MREELERLIGERVSAYSFFLMQLEGLLHGTVDAQNIMNRSSRYYRREALKASKSFGKQQRTIIESDVEKVYSQAISDVLSALPTDYAKRISYELIDDYLGTLTDNVISDITKQAERDVRSATERVTRILIDVSMKNPDVSHEGRLVATLLANNSELLRSDYIYRDRSGRRWRSDRFIQTILNRFYFTVYNETYIYVLNRYGVNIARATRPGKKDELFRIVEDDITSLPIFYQIRDTLFHPNSKAIVSNV